MQYQLTFGAIGGDDVVTLMIARLADPDFGLEAAGVLFELWQRQAGIPRSRFFGIPSFRDVRERRGDGGFRKTAHPFATAILDVARRLGDASSSEPERRLAISIASLAYLMPGPVDWSLVNAWLDTAGNRLAKQRLLTALAIRGEVIAADRALGGIRDLLQDAKTQSWLLGQDRSEPEEWLVLLALSDRPLATLEGLDLLPAQRQTPWALQRLLSTLGYAPSDDAETVLRQLADRDPRFRDTFEWSAAFEKRESLSAARTLLDLITGDSLGARRTLTGARHFAAQLDAHPEFRAELYARYRAMRPGQGKSLIEHIIVQACDAAGLFVLLDDFAASSRSFDGSLREAIRNIATRHEPSADWPGTHEIVTVPLARLRKELFALTGLDDPRAALAADCLTAIDELHDEYGSPEGDLRHPDIESGRPWPLIRAQSVEAAT
jgi:hypothetical protein